MRALAVGCRGQLRRLLGAVLDDALELLADLALQAGCARARDGSDVAVVGVDANEISSDGLGLDIGQDDISWPILLAAVSAAAEQLADVDDGVVLDGDRSLAVVLHDLVLCVLGATALDEDVARSLESDGIY